MTRVAYLCDGKACKHCHVETDLCTHTSDINHAINFEEIGPDTYMEFPEPTLLDLAITPEEFQTRMVELLRKYKYDVEEPHMQMDKLMCDTLRSLGYGGGVSIFLRA